MLPGAHSLPAHRSVVGIPTCEALVQLQPRQRYTISVRALNMGGPSAPSQPATVHTTGQCPPCTRVRPGRVGPETLQTDCRDWHVPLRQSRGTRAAPESALFDQLLLVGQELGPMAVSLSDTIHAT